MIFSLIFNSHVYRIVWFGLFTCQLHLFHIFFFFLFYLCAFIPCLLKFFPLTLPQHSIEAIHFVLYHLFVFSQLPCMCSWGHILYYIMPPSFSTHNFDLQHLWQPFSLNHFLNPVAFLYHQHHPSPYFVPLSPLHVFDTPPNPTVSSGSHSLVSISLTLLSSLS